MSDHYWVAYPVFMARWKRFNSTLFYRNWLNLKCSTVREGTWLGRCILAYFIFLHPVIRSKNAITVVIKKKTVVVKKINWFRFKVTGLIGNHSSSINFLWGHFLFWDIVTSLIFEGIPLPKCIILFSFDCDWIRIQIFPGI